MAVEIVAVESHSDLKKFVLFPFKLFKGNDNWVPPIIKDELDTFNPKKNPAFELCKSQQFIAYKEGDLVGRIACIIEEREAREKQLARFGWVDFIDDEEVSEALFSAAINWTRENGLSGLHGPLGFTDMDFEGMLVEGFEYPATIATIYNFPYYPEHLERLGFEKSVDWVEGRGNIPSEPSKKLLRTAQLVESRFGLRSLKFKSKRQAAKRGHEMFDVLNKSYENLYGFHPLTEKQIDFYIKQYLGFVIPDLMSMVVNKEDKLVAFAITLPSLSRAFQMANGRLFPFGFIHILRAMKREKAADMYLIGVLPEYQKMGATAIIFRDIIRGYNKRGITKGMTNQVLEKNAHLLTQFNDYQEDGAFYKRRRCYIKQL